MIFIRTSRSASHIPSVQYSHTHPKNSAASNNHDFAPRRSRRGLELLQVLLQLTHQRRLATVASSSIDHTAWRKMWVACLTARTAWKDHPNADPNKMLHVGSDSGSRAGEVSV